MLDIDTNILTEQREKFKPIKNELTKLTIIFHIYVNINNTEELIN